MDHPYQIHLRLGHHYYDDCRQVEDPLAFGKNDFLICRYISRLFVIGRFYIFIIKKLSHTKLIVQDSEIK